MAPALLDRQSYVVPLKTDAYLLCENRVLKIKDVLDHKVPEKKMNSETKNLHKNQDAMYIESGKEGW